MTKKRMIHSTAAVAVLMVVLMAMLVCAPRAAMAADAQTSVSGSSGVTVLSWPGSVPTAVLTGVSASTADSLNTGTATATSVGNAVGATSINGSGNTLTATTGTNTINAAAANNAINAATTNAITGGTAFTDVWGKFRPELISQSSRLA